MECDSDWSDTEQMDHMQLSEEATKELNRNEEEKDQILRLIQGEASAHLDAMIEDPVSVPLYLQNTQLTDPTLFEQVHPQDLSKRLSPEWRDTLTQTCTEEGQSAQELEERIARGAAYLCQVRIEHWTKPEDKYTIYEFMLKHEKLWNINGL